MATNYTTTEPSALPTYMLVDKEGRTKPIDEKEISILIGEVCKMGWAVFDIARVLKAEFKDSNSIMEPSSGASPYIFDVLVDALERLGDQQNTVAHKLEEELGIPSERERVRYNMYLLPDETKKFTDYVVRA